MFTSLDLILLRHADCNQISVQQNYPKTPQNLQMAQKYGKNDEDLGDKHLTQNGRKQCKEIAEILNWDTIQVIIVSPLKRCLNTCRQLLKYSNKKVKVYVQPLLTARVTSRKARGTSKKQLQKQYQQFCFSCLNEYGNLPWYLNYLFNKKKRNILKLENPSEFLQQGILQDPYQFRDRVKSFEKKLRQHLSNIKQGKRIMIISHNQVFREMTAKFYTADGQSISDFQFDNGQLRYLSSGQVFNSLFPSPSL